MRQSGFPPRFAGLTVIGESDGTSRMIYKYRHSPLTRRFAPTLSQGRGYFSKELRVFDPLPWERVARSAGRDHFEAIERSAHLLRTGAVIYARAYDYPQAKFKKTRVEIFRLKTLAITQFLISVWYKWMGIMNKREAAKTCTRLQDRTRLPPSCGKRLRGGPKKRKTNPKRTRTNPRRCQGPNG